MAKDVSAILAKLDAKVVEITAQDDRADDKEILESIGKEKLQNYLAIMPMKAMFVVLKSGGYKGTIVSLRKQLAAMGAREIQPRPCLEKGKGKGKQRGKKQEGKRKDGNHEELTQVSLLTDSKAQEKQPETQAEKPAQQSGRELAQQSAQQPEKPAQQSGQQSGTQSGKSVFIPRSALARPAESGEAEKFEDLFAGAPRGIGRG